MYVSLCLCLQYLSFTVVTPVEKAAVFAQVLPMPEKASVQVRIIVQECCRSDLVPLQLRLFNKFLIERYELFIVGGGKNAQVSQELALLSKQHANVQFLECGKSLAECYTISYRQLVVSFRGLVMFANSDMFLWRAFSLKQYLGAWNASFAGLIETHGRNGDYIHPGLQLLNTLMLPEDFAKTVMWDLESGGDVGSMTRRYLDGHPQFRMHAMTWSRNFDLSTVYHLRLIPKEMLDLFRREKEFHPESLVSDLYLENFAILHPRGASGWGGDVNAKMQRVKVFLEARLRDAPLTWSTMSAATTKPISQLMVHVQQWTPYTLGPTQTSPAAGKLNGRNSTGEKLNVQNSTGEKLNGGNSTGEKLNVRNSLAKTAKLWRKFERARKKLNGVVDLNARA